MTATTESMTIANRFRNHLPVVVDIETAGLNPKTEASLQTA